MTNHLLFPEIRKMELRRRSLSVRLNTCRYLTITRCKKIIDSFLMVIPWTPNLTISGYWPMKGEVDVRQLLYTLVECGCTIVLPMVAAKNKPLLFFHWLPGMSLTIGLHKTYHPLITNIALTPDLLIVPLLGFDRHGNRLGYGGGYYDRTITELRNKRTTVTVGIAYETQEISHIPHEQHDQRLDWIVTEKSIFKSLS